MKNEIEIHMAEHKETGAIIPITINKINSNFEIEDYEEYKKHRKVFSLEMIIRRWKKNKEEVISILNKYKVPGNINFNDIKDLPKDSFPIDHALFFEEYILAIEKKLNLPHKKIKPKFYVNGENK